MPWQSGAFSSLSRQTAAAEVGACLLHALPMPFNRDEQEWVGRHSLWTGACWDVSGGVVPGTWLLIHHLRALYPGYHLLYCSQRGARELPGLTGRGWPG